MINIRNKLSAFRHFFLGSGVRRTLTVSALILCFMGAAVGVSMQYLKVVYVRDKGELLSYYTFKTDAETILAEKGIATMAFDTVDFTGFQDKMGVININRAVPVTITADGTTVEVMTPEMPVRDVLQQQKIQLDTEDSVNIPLHFYVSSGDEIIVTRIDDVEIVKTEDIPFSTVYKETPLLKKGQTKILTPGKVGKIEKTYLQTNIDGEVQSEVLISQTIASEPADQISLIGASVPVSQMDFGAQLDENGKPVSYQALLTNQVSTGYSAKAGAWGASGLNLIDGCVAVRSSQIPYGTKMYITSADGSFVYGYAIAADTGSGLMQNAIDLDLFYESYLESCLNGRKYLDVYVLEWGNGKNAWEK